MGGWLLKLALVAVLFVVAEVLATANLAPHDPSCPTPAHIEERKA